MPLKKKVPKGDGMDVSDGGSSDGSDSEQEFDELNEVRMFCECFGTNDETAS